jgi:hypothetical protein
VNDTPQKAHASNWSAGRVIGLVFASIGGLAGLSLLVAGVAIMAAYAFSRDDDGYFKTDRRQLESGTYAITAEDIDLGADELEWVPDGILGDVRVRVESRKPVFVGIGPDSDVDRYLGDVLRDELVDFIADEPRFDLHEGTAPRSPPGEQGFWVAQSAGAGEQSLKWDAEFGRWTLVVMNADASRVVQVEADAGVKLDWVIWAGLGTFLVGVLLTAGAIVVILLIGRRAERGGAQT